MARRKKPRKPSGDIGRGALQIQLRAVMEGITAEVQQSFYDACDKIGEEAVQKLRASSPRRKGGSARYANGWVYDQTATGGVVHNATDYQLTHLLEYGHDVYDHNHRKVGHAPAIPHIKDVETWATNALIEETERLINGNL